jgi:arsenate reductase
LKHVDILDGGVRRVKRLHAPRELVVDQVASLWLRAMAGTRQRVLFLCTHNSARSQMAEGLLRHLGGARFDAFSAGTEATRVRPLAIRAMAELGIDISGHESKTLDRYLNDQFDKVITVCDDANEACPVFYGARERLHWSFPDPSKATGSEAEQLAVYRDVRDAIRTRIQQALIAPRS